MPANPHIHFNLQPPHAVVARESAPLTNPRLKAVCIILEPCYSKSGVFFFMAKPFRVLLVYPNYMMVNLLPTNIGILTSCLKTNGYEVGLFDTTYYRTAEKSLDEIRVETLQLRKFSLEDFGVHYKTSNYLEDFVKKVEEFQPDLIGMTVVEDTWPQGLTMLEHLHQNLKQHIPTILGGVFATFSPAKIIEKPFVDFVCVGEGEEALIELCDALKSGSDTKNIKNIWAKDASGKVFKNTLRAPIPMDQVSLSDWGLFEKERFYRPMQGRVHRMVPIETDRGCPYTCRFCEAPALNNLYRQETGGRYFRRKSTRFIEEEISSYIEKYNAEYIYFNAETFLAMSEREFDEFIEMYSRYRLPFWCQTRIETFSKKRLQALEEVGCNRISVGLEHGNEEFRRKVIGKGFTNAMMIEAFKLIETTSIPITVNNIVGFPGETRELAFDTIELNRNLSADSINAFYFVPYQGTPFYKECIDQGYITEDTRTGSLAGGSVLNMPNFSSDEIRGLVRTFSLYTRFPKKEWPLIKRAEKFDAEGDRIFKELGSQYYERFFDDDLKSTKRACFSTAIYSSPSAGLAG